MRAPLMAMLMPLMFIGHGAHVTAATAEGGEVPAISDRRAIKNAREALAGGHMREAELFYEMVAASSRLDPTSEMRAEAFYNSGMLRLQDDSVNPIDRKGLEYLDEYLHLFPGHSYSAGARAAIDLVKRTERAEADAARRAEELAKLQEAMKAEREDLTGKVKAAQDDAASRTEDLKGQLERCDRLEAEIARQGGELESLRATIAAQEETITKKNDALRRLRKALVQPRAPITPGGAP